MLAATDPLPDQNLRENTGSFGPQPDKGYGSGK